MTSDRNHSRDEAYALGDSDSHRSYYDGWAASYDIDFADAEGYVYPENLSRRFLELASRDDSPVADLGCGTGLAGAGFRDSGLVIDGFDISPGMLAEARRKGVYRDLVVADLTAPDNERSGRYGGLISCGTFTLGHLGPDALTESLGFGRPGSLCVIGINAQHYSEAGFDKCFERLATAGRISPVIIEQTPIYRNAREASEVKMAKLAIFRKT